MCQCGRRARHCWIVDVLCVPQLSVISGTSGSAGRQTSSPQLARRKWRAASLAKRAPDVTGRREGRRRRRPLGPSPAPTASTLAAAGRHGRDHIASMTHVAAKAARPAHARDRLGDTLGGSEAGPVAVGQRLPGQVAHGSSLLPGVDSPGGSGHVLAPEGIVAPPAEASRSHRTMRPMANRSSSPGSRQTAPRTQQRPPPHRGRSACRTPPG